LRMRWSTWSHRMLNEKLFCRCWLLLNSFCSSDRDVTWLCSYVWESSFSFGRRESPWMLSFSFLWCLICKIGNPSAGFLAFHALSNKARRMSLI
jgi:hypothetical protein